MRFTFVWVGSVNTPMSLLSFTVNNRDTLLTRLTYHFGESVVSAYIAWCYFHSSLNYDACNGLLNANPSSNFPLPLIERHSRTVRLSWSALHQVHYLLLM
ncbi:hypothetical protein FNW02_28880 [Komarekiella sp. 'clone 1']|uniref:Uncharacterized protein n=1 Tax=Komarekiella delphini-convector SJRDD-AB1 TaxID=2593771 RepID=A0AA40T2H1_9NOST|nr:hypothetical protein [Komarekiella delphini-convector]MBD6619721.1 hypothetical protein [Komarekiella delphini-convector SJRDD-AB1]